MNKHVKMTIGIVAGVIGAVIARQNALETVDKLEAAFTKKKHVEIETHVTDN